MSASLDQFDAGEADARNLSTTSSCSLVSGHGRDSVTEISQSVDDLLVVDEDSDDVDFFGFFDESDDVLDDESLVEEDSDDFGVSTAVDDDEPRLSFL